METKMARVDRASQLIAASPERLYRAFVEPDALVSWLPPDGARGRIDVFEPKPNGAFRMTLTFDSAHGKSTDNTDVVNARFIELIPNQHIAWAIDFESEDPSFRGTMKMSWTFQRNDAGTLVAVEASDVPAGIAAEDHKNAMASSLRHLAAHVAKE